MPARSGILVNMNRLCTEKRAHVIAGLVEGNSIRATCRMTGVAKNTVVKLLVDTGTACQAYHDEHVRGLEPGTIRCKEIWAVCYTKEANVPWEQRGHHGHRDIWTWTALDSDTRLIVSWHVTQRRALNVREFMLDLADRMTKIVQLTPDGFMPHADVAKEAFGTSVDYGIVVKSHSAERADDAFSKKFQNLEAAVALHFTHYNYCRRHQVLGKTPAMAAGLVDHAWPLEKLVALLETAERSN
jgi:hypothetical protein